MPLKIVDRTDEFMIQKVTKTNGEFVRYQTVPAAMNDFSAVRYHETLAEARERVGKVIEANGEQTTKPKSEYAQCQKGYRANTGKGR